MKFYIHYELGEPEYTLPITVDPSSESRTVNDIKVEFINAYNARFGRNQLDAESHSLSLSKHKTLAGADQIVSVVKPNSDVYMVARKAESKQAKCEAAAEPKVTSTETSDQRISARTVHNPSVSTQVKSTLQQSNPTPKQAAPEQKASPNESRSKWTRPKPINLCVPPQVTQVRCAILAFLQRFDMKTTY